MAMVGWLPSHVKVLNATELRSRELKWQIIHMCYHSKKNTDVTPSAQNLPLMLSRESGSAGVFASSGVNVTD